MDESQLQDLLDKVTEWAMSQGAIMGVALVGSHARGTAKPDSDVDLVILSSSVDELISNRSWLENFGQVKSCVIEDWGLVTSLRVHYQDGKEVEFGLASPGWVSVPVDEGTERVIKDGIKIVFDQEGILKSRKNRSSNKNYILISALIFRQDKSVFAWASASARGFRLLLRLWRNKMAGQDAVTDQDLLDSIFPFLVSSGN